MDMNRVIIKDVNYHSTHWKEEWDDILEDLRRGYLLSQSAALKELGTRIESYYDSAMRRENENADDFFFSFGIAALESVDWFYVVSKAKFSFSLEFPGQV